MKDKPDTKSLLQRWKNREKTAVSTTASNIGKAPENIAIPLSSGQERLWFLEQLYPKNPVYNYSELAQFSGKLNTTILKEAVQLVFNDNEILRTSFESGDQEMIQVLDRAVELEILEIDLSNYPPSERESKKDSILLEDARKPFDLSSAPLMRVHLIKLDEAEWILFTTMHHIITDKWSMGVFRDQLAEHYKNLSEGKKSTLQRSSIQFSDYAYWQRNNKPDEVQLNYWREKLKGKIPVLNLPADFSSPKTPSFNGFALNSEFSKALSKQLLDLAKTLETTPYVLLLSVYYLMLFRYSGQTDLLVGSPISNRNEKALENLIGFFDETIILRTALDSEMSFAELVKEVKVTVLDAFSNRDTPFNLLVQELKPERQLSSNPFFRSMFIYHVVPTIPTFGKDLKFRYSTFDSGVSKFDLTLFVGNNKEQLFPAFEYTTDLFEESTIAQFHKHFELLCQMVVNDPNLSLSDFEMLTSDEKELFFGNESPAQVIFKGYSGIHEIIEDVALKFPNAKALSFKNETVTYSELNERAKTLALKIFQYTRGRNEVIGLCADRSVSLIIGLLAILKSGNAYMPLDPEYPEDRIDFMLKDSKVSVVVTEKDLIPLLDGFKGNAILLEEEDQKEKQDGALLPKANLEDLAYVIYTSGSTGKPKGVPIKHRNIIASTEGRLQYYEERPEAFLLMSSLSFDSSKAGLFWTLCTGGTLVISEKRLEQDISRLSEIIATKKVSHTLMLPSLYTLILEHGDLNKLLGLKVVIVAGEACYPSLVEQHFKRLPETKLYNEYGPTEATVWCMVYQLKKEDQSRNVPIGKAVAKARIYLLDKKMNLVPKGAEGEIYIGGPGLAGAYLNRTELTEQFYPQDPFASEGSREKLYKTGDLGRYRKDGNIEFLGRADDQIKLRGYRIELEEIEKQLLSGDFVQGAAVVLVEADVQRLVAFVVAQDGFKDTALKEQLKSSLPNYMIPSRILEIDEIPVLPNKKTDRNSLKEYLNVDNRATAGKELPATEVQRKLAAVWEEVLKIKPVGIHDNFFALGGDSISSIQIIAKARNLGIELKASQLFDSQTIAELSLFAKESGKESDESKAVTGKLALSPIQYWFFSTHKNAPHFWNNAVQISGAKESIPEHFKIATNALVAHHDAFRLSFIKTQSTWEAEILADSDLDSCFLYEDVSDIKELEKQNSKITQIFREIQDKCDLKSGGLLKTIYFDCGALQANKVFIVAHHLVIDIVSWNNLLGDFRSILEQLKNGEPIKLRQKTASVKDWANRLMELSKSKEILDELPFWKAQKTDIKSFPVDFQTKSKSYPEKAIVIRNHKFSEKDTSLLLLQANEAYNTRVEDLILTALYFTICDWADTNKLLLGIERHGRSPKPMSLDVSNTMGWFTSFFPILLKAPAADNPGPAITAIKELLRDVPNEGIGYGILKYLTQDETISASLDQQPHLIFNYLGVQNTNEDDKGPVFTQLWDSVRHPLSERHYSMEINAFVSNNQLNINWSYAKEVYKESTIEDLIQRLDLKLKTVIEHCIEKEVGGYTPSDFPEADMSQDDLDELMRRLNT